MIMKHKEIDTPVEHKVSTGVSFLFMFLVGMSMPHFIGVNFAETHAGTHSVTGSQEMMSWGMIALHVLIVSLLSNIGKLFPVFFTGIGSSANAWRFLSVCLPVVK